MGRSHQLAAGQVGNLTAQFNDIGVMMAAGQNPFQLAIQQGTQITQVIGPMGAAGAAKALKAALVSMLSPMTFITIGSIAAAAAMMNWLTGAEEDAVSFEDQLEAVGDAIDSYRDKAQKTRFSTAEMVEEFGKASPELRLVLADNRDDKVPRMLSPGETVVHAKATRKYRPVLQAMNDGVEIPGLANGGEIGTGASGGASYGALQGNQVAHSRVEILPSPLFEAKVTELSAAQMAQGLEHYDREVAPGTIHRVSNDPLGVG